MVSVNVLSCRFKYIAMHETQVYRGRFVDVFKRDIYSSEIAVQNGRIKSVRRVAASPDQYILPGFVDAHVHIESSMLVPTEFARLAVTHGTVATVSDPHEIANVCGISGVQFMIDNSKQTPLKIFFGAPSCVPATFFETAGATLDATAVSQLLSHPDIWYLAEVMNYPGVLNGDPDVIAKINAAKDVGKPIDGHAPGLMGALARQYADADITTDHECFTLEEALDKIKAGMHCLIREGSAAKNFEALIDVIRMHPEKVMFCSDDKHPDELLLHHINTHVQRAVKKGYDLFDVLRAASVNPVAHYNLPVGLLREDDPADFIVVDDLANFNVLQTYINGQLVAEKGKSLLQNKGAKSINHFNAEKINSADIKVWATQEKQIRVIEAIEGQLITNEIICKPKIEGGNIIGDVENDNLKLVVVNRYKKAPPAVAFIRNFGFKKGAIASTVAHDCHNIIAVGVDDETITAAINELIDVKGGISVALSPDDVKCMPLPIAGLMTDDDGYKVAEKYSALDRSVKEQLGSSLNSPFMTLSFMALLVIPFLKLSDKGLFDGACFCHTNLQTTG